MKKSISWKFALLLLSSFLLGYLYPLAGILLFAIGNRKRWNPLYGRIGIVGGCISLFLYTVEYVTVLG